MKPKRGMFSVYGWAHWQWRTFRSYRLPIDEWRSEAYEFMDMMPAWPIWLLVFVAAVTFLALPVALVVGVEKSAEPLLILSTALASALTSLLYYAKYVSESKDKNHSDD